ncbi:MAG: thioredoxin family protein [Alphaproteobacteria bacterium]|nr:thioredoxin family protein [Alphaproteobacteria bacterium]MBU1514313.1 thioredoxin family protein [Alphaproteobacteria bacterium]MBU2095957.1 thioredoxin family protein [Alphaproteobacteria bacterium]MBU2153055.1 thioredoxin family protein [Alphaproteobacteria bacterium]MBU2308512.1 thioredoxin family protein [Alphaproteobacteria bacterium]
MNRLAAAAACFALAAGSAAAAPPPRVSITDYVQLHTPLPYPYDEAADASAAVDRALARARKSGKRVIIDMGGNWCGDCRILAATMELPEMKAFLDRHFEIVSIDVGRMDKNLQVPARYGITTRLEGVPALLVVDPKTGKQLVGKAQVSALADARHMHPQDLADWFAQWTR